MTHPQRTSVLVLGGRFYSRVLWGQTVIGDEVQLPPADMRDPLRLLQLGLVVQLVLCPHTDGTGPRKYSTSTPPVLHQYSTSTPPVLHQCPTSTPPVPHQ